MRGIHPCLGPIMRFISWCHHAKEREMQVRWTNRLTNRFISQLLCMVKFMKLSMKFSNFTIVADMYQSLAKSYTSCTFWWMCHGQVVRMLDILVESGNASDIGAGVPTGTQHMKQFTHNWYLPLLPVHGDMFPCLLHTQNNMIYMYIYINIF